MGQARDGEEPRDRGTTDVPAVVVQYEHHGVWIVVAHGAFDPNSISPLADALNKGARKYPKLVLDASRLTFVDSTLVHLLLRIRPLTTLCVASPAPLVQRILELTGADAVLDVRATVEDAVAR
jgi:anti-anti-sigma factor